MSVASVLAGAASVTPWAISELIQIIEKRKQAEQHGMYYLLNFVH
jgi:phage portal protein BeeE